MEINIKKIVDALMANNAQYIARVQKSVNLNQMAKIMADVKIEMQRRLQENKDAEAKKLGYK